MAHPLHPRVPRLHLFRGGRQTAMSGLTRVYDAAGIAASYDPALHEAPIVIGHPRHDAPAYGWVTSLSAEGDDLWGEAAQVEPQFAEAVQAGRYKKLSVSLYLEDSPAHPVRVAGGTPTAPYLRHVGFLGAQAPAVKGLAPVEFGEDEEGVAVVEFSETDTAASADAPAWTVRALVSMLRSVMRAHIARRDGEDAAEAALPSLALDGAAESLAHQEGVETPAFSESTSPDPASMADTPTDQAVAEREAAVAEREAALARREAALAAAEAERQRAEHAAFAESLSGILPRHAPVVAGVLNALAGCAEADTVAFGEAALVPAEALRQMLQELPPLVDVGERSAARNGDDAAGEAAGEADFAAPPGHAIAEHRLALHRKALAYQAAHPGTDYLAAALAVSQPS